MNNADVLKILNKVGEDFGWQMGKVGANYENGYMKAIRDCKQAFNHIVEANKMIDQFREDTKKVVTNADRIRNMSDEELFELLRKTKYCPPVMCKKINGYHISCKECIVKWLKKKVE